MERGVVISISKGVGSTGVGSTGGHSRRSAAQSDRSRLRAAVHRVHIRQDTGAGQGGRTRDAKKGALPGKKKWATLFLHLKEKMRSGMGTLMSARKGPVISPARRLRRLPRRADAERRKSDCAGLRSPAGSQFPPESKGKFWGSWGGAKAQRGPGRATKAWLVV